MNKSNTKKSQLGKNSWGKEMSQVDFMNFFHESLILVDERWRRAHYYWVNELATRCLHLVEVRGER